MNESYRLALDEMVAYIDLCDHDALSENTTIVPILVPISAPSEEKGWSKCSVCGEKIQIVFEKTP